MICRGWSILRSSLILDISYISSIVVSMIVDMLDSPIRKVDRVGTINIASAIRGLCSSKRSTAVLIMHSILILVGVRFLFVHWLWCMICRSMVGWGSMHYRSMISWSMDNRRMIRRDRGMVGRSMVSQGFGETEQRQHKLLK